MFKLCLKNKTTVILITLLIIAAGLFVAPFDWSYGNLPRNPVSVDAIPDIGDNQQIVFTSWAGRSPQDVQDQLTYPLSTALLGMPGVTAVRSSSNFGFSVITIVFEDGIDFYWSRSRLLEKLSSLPNNLLPENVKPSLGPDATGLGQIFWYTIEAYDKDNKPVNSSNAWDLHEIREIQDTDIRYALQSVQGVSEVASVGGYKEEYQVDINPELLRSYNLSISDVYQAIRGSNGETGARTIEINKIEYLVRVSGFINSLEDLRKSVIAERKGTPVLLSHVSKITSGPSIRRGVLDNAGVEAVGGVVVARFGSNPMKVIERVKEKIIKLNKSLPRKTLKDGREISLQIVPFYDRGKLIKETVKTLETTLTDEILITLIVVIFMLFNLRSSFVVASLVPIAVLAAFVSMKMLNIEANVVALSGIAIAIGTMVDMGIVISENIYSSIQKRTDKSKLETVLSATKEVASSVITSTLTTIVSFIPVFALQQQEGKLFGPLAWTKTSALVAALLLSLFLLPVLSYIFYNKQKENKDLLSFNIKKKRFSLGTKNLKVLLSISIGLAFIYILGNHWEMLGANNKSLGILIVAGIIISVLVAFYIFKKLYLKILSFCINKWYIIIPIPIIIVLTISMWTVSSWKKGDISWEFRPSLDEGSYLLMPMTAATVSIDGAKDMLRIQDINISKIPEVEKVVGKIGRAESALDPAPVAMVETVIIYKDEYGLDENGNTIRNWRDHIKTPKDIWKEIAKAADIPGMNQAPELQPIAARQAMLRTGLRSNFGIKIFGDSLDELSKAVAKIEPILKEIEGVEAATVNADTVEGKPYIIIKPNREKAARYGVSIKSLQETISMAVEGKVATISVQGDKQYPVRIRFMRERRDNIDSIKQIPISVQGNKAQTVPLGMVAEISYKRGPASIKGEAGKLTANITFDKTEKVGELEVALKVKKILEQENLPYRWELAGVYEDTVRALDRLTIISIVSLILIFMILYIQFKSVFSTVVVFSGVLIAASGGMAMLLLYGNPEFMNFWGLREIFHIERINLSVAVAVGFLALFGIATDDGVLQATYIKQKLKDLNPKNKADLKTAILEAAKKRIRPCLMTTATTLLAILPIITSSGRGADIMIPMAIPAFGGMCLLLLNLYFVPMAYYVFESVKLRKGK